MMNVTWHQGVPALPDVAAHLGVPLEAFDSAFGVIATSPDQHIYTVRLRSDYAERQSGTDGPFPEVRIAPFGIPKS